MTQRDVRGMLERYRALAGAPAGPARTRCGTATRPTCWREAPTCGRAGAAGALP